MDNEPVVAKLEEAHGPSIYTASFAEKPCTCVKHHSPVPLAVEMHHEFPKGIQEQIYGEVRDKTLIPLCDVAHKNIHMALSAWLKNKPFVLGNRHQRAIAYRGYQKIKESLAEHGA